MENIYLLAIETSCDDTSAAVLKNNVVLSNIIANQDIHQDFGGVIPELASRAHQQHIIPVVDKALKSANINKKNLNAIVFTKGPGLLGSLMVGVSFAKSMSQFLNIPLIETDHLHSHIYALFLDKPDITYKKPNFPFIALLISGGHSKIGIVHDFLNIEFIGDTIDDAAGEAFDKTAKIMGLQYPGGPIIDKLAINGNPNKFKFNKPNIPDYNFSFSGLKTSFLYFVRDELIKDKNFIENNINDLCASIQNTIIEILLEKIKYTVAKTGIKDIGIVGGVSANSYLKKIFSEYAKTNKLNVFFPEIGFSTDNAAMIGIHGYLKYQKGLFSNIDVSPYAS